MWDVFRINAYEDVFSRHKCDKNPNFWFLFFLVTRKIIARYAIQSDDQVTQHLVDFTFEEAKEWEQM